MHVVKSRRVKPGFHIIAPVATIAAVVEKRVSATVAIYGTHSPAIVATGATAATSVAEIEKFLSRR